jgi:hypothetical protein
VDFLSFRKDIQLQCFRVSCVRILIASGRLQEMDRLAGGMCAIMEVTRSLSMSHFAMHVKSTLIRENTAHSVFKYTGRKILTALMEKSGLAVTIAHAGDGYMWIVKSVQSTKLIQLLSIYVPAAERSSTRN